MAVVSVCAFRKCFFSALFFLLLSGTLNTSAAQSATPAVSGWTRVQALRKQTKIKVYLDHGSRSCRVYSVTEDALTCARGKDSGDVIRRTQIREIKVPHVLRSTLAGLGIGIGVGAVTGYAVGAAESCKMKPCIDIIGSRELAAIGAVGFGVIGTAVGAATDLTRGGPIYRDR